MALTDAQCKNAKCPADKARIRVVDGAGLYLEVAATGSKRWFWKYYFDGKEKRLALGQYPGLTAKAARSKRDAACLLQQSGTDPAHQRIVDKLQRKAASVNTFEAVTRDYHATRVSDWSEAYAERWLVRLEKDVFSWIGKLPLTDSSAAAGYPPARRGPGRARVGALFARGALKAVATKHMAAVLEPVAAGALMRSILAYEGQPTTRAALELSALVFQRPGNIRALEWAWVDLGAAMISIPAADMKRKRPASSMDARTLCRLHCAQWIS
ncbi:tyrosine-type recombinase/integrase [Roseateles toxinivorans]|uniref:Uncharacterized protein DUF4102 n=1 Tax=Roseateles toxinivorans TaxID=270368 RepID=A0A4R6QU75_9BURK|nr:integrase arm-type DNA-binding domain-containing protein [Roseateles toxinivorans]TDP74489.1 uncharacterized protein DUF4102 [Roseateles toxinivorans]